MKKIVFAAAVCSLICSGQEPVAVPDVKTAVPMIGGLQVNLKPVLNAPYQAEADTDTVQQLADGTTIRNHQVSERARDSQGRTWTQESIHKLGPWTTQTGDSKIIFINDPAAGVSYVLHSDNKTAERLPGPPNIAGAAKVKVLAQAPDVMFGAGPMISIENNLTTSSVTAPANATTEDLGMQSIGGVPAQGKRVTHVIAANSIGNDRDIRVVDETWFAPSLQMVVQQKHSDPRFGETTFSLTNVREEEPAPDLFRVPADYTISDTPKPMISIMR